MPLQASDIAPISETRDRLAEATEDMVGGGSEVLAEDAIIGLRQTLAGQFVSDEELDRALNVASVPQASKSKSGSFTSNPQLRCTDHNLRDSA
jgi:hypothetical protein